MQHILRLGLCLLSLWMVTGNSPSLTANESDESSAIELMTDAEPVKASLISEEDSIQPGRPFWIGIRLAIDSHWHAYWKNPGDAGMAPNVSWSLPDGFEVSALQWPTPKRFMLNSTVGFGYEDELVLLAQVTPPSSFNNTASVDVAAEIRWVVCSDSTCLPGDAHVSLPLPITKEAPQASSQWSETFAKVREQLPKKHEAIAAQRKQNLIEVSFTDDLFEKRTFSQAHFYPERKKTIDYKAEAHLNYSSESQGQYTVILKEAETATVKASSLKGILVLHSSNHAEAYEVDVPIKALDNEELISMSDSIGAHVTSEETDLSPPQASDFEFKGGIALAVALAFLGGLILNLMPCVLPVISFKVMSFIKLAGESRKLIWHHGLAFAFGVLLSFWVLAASLLALQAYGRSVGWGFQLQEPLFVALLAALLLVFSLSLFGLFEVGTSLISVAGQAQNASNKKGGLLSSFLSGILATAVATPCTGPFLGSAVGFAVTQPAPLALLIFTSLGLGMSFPYLALAAFPALLRFMPKPGNWMITFKELMGFFMMATVLWLVWVFGAQTNSFSLTLLLAGFFLLSIAGWIYGRWATPMRKQLSRLIGTVTAMLFCILGGYVVILSTTSWAEAMGGGPSSAKKHETGVADVWEEFSPERVAELRAQGIPVFIDFTAKWCLICQANHLILSVDEVSQKFSKHGVVKMKADWTKNDPTITKELRKFGRNGVPLYLLYGNDGEASPEILPQVLTPEIVLESLKKLEE